MQARKIMRSNSLKIEGDKSGGEKCLYENALVDIMEKFLTEKITKTQEIKNTYETQMQEIREMGDNSIILEILKQMECSMFNEIEILKQKIEQEKAQAISKIKIVQNGGNI